jgi:hypothetical protein
MRYVTKRALIADIEKEHDALVALLRQIPKSRYSEPGVWGDDWSLKDLVAHLAAWHSLFLTWFEDGLKGNTPAMPAPDYTWRDLPELNRNLQAKHHRRSAAAVRIEYDTGYRRIMSIIRSLPPERLLVAGHFVWTGKNPLATYIGPNTASHYRFASRVIRRWLKKDPRSISP